ncbi:MAG TPA: hypothetical protein DEP19_05655, partial [Anaerolineae bacterium]|nr:hypothetical protein [Anaerolineae bacterium]
MYNVEVNEKNFTTDELSVINSGFRDVTNVIGQENASTLFEGWEIKNKTWGLGEWFCGTGSVSYTHL